MITGQQLFRNFHIGAIFPKEFATSTQEHFTRPSSKLFKLQEPGSLELSALTK